MPWSEVGVVLDQGFDDGSVDGVDEHRARDAAADPLPSTPAPATWAGFVLHATPVAPRRGRPGTRRPAGPRPAPPRSSTFIFTPVTSEMRPTTASASAAQRHPSLTSTESSQTYDPSEHGHRQHEIDHPGDAPPAVVGEAVCPGERLGVEVVGERVTMLAAGRLIARSGIVAHPPTGYERAVSVHASRIRFAVTSSASGMVRVFAVAVMKLASPVQRGTT